MKPQLQLAAEERTVLGKQVKHLRQKGLVPASLGGRNQTPLSLQINRALLQKVLSQGGANTILSLTVGAQPPVQALIREVQRDPISREILNVDLHRVVTSEKLRTHVPLRFVGHPAVPAGGDATLMRSMNDVLVECYPADLPSAVDVDLSRLVEIGSAIRVGELDAGPNATILTPHEELVVSLLAAARRAAAESEEQEEREAKEEKEEAAE